MNKTEESKMKQKITKEELKVGDEIYTGTRNDRKRKVTSINMNLPTPEAMCDGWSIVLRADGFWGADGSSGFAMKEDGLEPKYLITYDLISSGDPVKYAGNMAQVITLIEALLNNKDVVRDSIRVYTISKIQKVGFKVTLKD